MPQIAEDNRLPADVDAQPPVQAAAALRPVIRGYHEEIEREQRLPKALVEQFHAAGLYRLVVPRELGGLQVDLLTFLRAAEMLAEADGSVGWNIGNNAIGQLISLSLPEAGVEEIYASGPDTIIAGTAVPGGRHGRRRRWRLSRHRPLALRQRLSGKPVDAGQLPDPRRRPAAQEPRRARRPTGGASSRARRRRSSRKLGRDRATRDRAASTGRSRTSSCRSVGRWSTPASRSTISGAAGQACPTRCPPRPGWDLTTAR